MLLSWNTGDGASVPLGESRSAVRNAKDLFEAGLLEVLESNSVSRWDTCSAPAATEPSCGCVGEGDGILGSKHTGDHAGSDRGTTGGIDTTHHITVHAYRIET